MSDQGSTADDSADEVRSSPKGVLRTQRGSRHEQLLDEAIGTMPNWLVPVIQFNELLADRMGVTPSALQCLFALAKNGPTTPGVLARRVNLTTGAASRMIERLHSSGHVRRVPDPDDRRKVIIEPTRRALRLVSKHYSPLNEQLRAHLSDFDDSQLTRMIQFLHAAATSTEQEIRKMQDEAR